MSNLAAFFEQANWPAAEVEPDVWHCAFTGPSGAAYHLYVLAADDWLHFAVSPLLHAAELAQIENAGSGPLPPALLRANQALRLARLALDDDGDINLLADLPAAHTNAAFFTETLELLAGYADELASPLRQASS